MPQYLILVSMPNPVCPFPNVRLVTHSYPRRRPKGGCTPARQVVGGGGVSETGSGRDGGTVCSELSHDPITGAGALAQITSRHHPVRDPRGRPALARPPARLVRLPPAAGRLYRRRPAPSPVTLLGKTPTS